MKETLGALTDMLKAANTYIEADKCFADHLENMGTNSLKTGSQHPTIGKFFSPAVRTVLPCNNVKQGPRLWQVITGI